MEEHILKSPPYDPELKRSRERLEYYTTMPDQGIDDETGVIFWITGWGMDLIGDYSEKKLMPYLANTHNALVVTVRYQGYEINYATKEAPKVHLPEGWEEAVCQHYGLPSISGYDRILKHLRQNGIHEIDARFPVFIDYGEEYMSFGFMPVLDHIAVLGDVLRNYPVNRKRINVLGTSYGGYIAALMLKFAPHTFSVVVENSGFTKARQQYFYSAETGDVLTLNLDNSFKLPAYAKTPWRFKDERSPNFFHPAFKLIRDLNQIDHMQKSDTRLYSFHSEHDEMTPCIDKEIFCKTRAQMAPTIFHKITQADLDGHVFKTLEHGMKASMRGIYDRVAQECGNLSRASDKTDFERQTELTLDCGRKKYRATFTMDYRFSCEIL